MNRLNTMVRSRFADWAETRDRKILREAITLQMLVTAIRCRHEYDLSVSVGHDCWNGGEKNIKPNSFTFWHKERNRRVSE